MKSRRILACARKVTGKDVTGARNNAELFSRQDIDVVMIATADFQHVQHGVAAVRAGKDAYIEKPLAHTMSKAQDIRRAVQESGKVVQVFRLVDNAHSAAKLFQDVVAR